MTETIHACPPGLSGVTPCCGKTPFELPRTDRMTVDPQAVTCPGTPAPASALVQCPTCGLTPSEPHPRLPVDRCSNCKTHAPGPDACVRLAKLTAGIGYPVRCPHCGPDAGPVPPTHWTKHLQRHHPNAPAVCTGTDGFCDVHGYDRHPTAPDGLRDRYAAAIREWHGDWTKDTFADAADAADAVIAVRDEELQRLRAETATADRIRAEVQRDRDRLEAELTRLHNADSADAAAGSYAHRAETAEAERDALQDRLEFTEAALSRIRDRLEVQVVRETKRAEQAEAAFAAEQDISRRLLEQRQEMAAERFAWQERGDRAEAAVERLHEDIAYRDRKIEGTQAANDRVRDLADRWENALLPDRPYARALRDALDEPSDGAGADTPRPCGDVLEHPGHQFMRLNVLFNCPGNTLEDPS